MGPKFEVYTQNSANSPIYIYGMHDAYYDWFLFYVHCAVIRRRKTPVVGAYMEMIQTHHSMETMQHGLSRPPSPVLPLFSSLFPGEWDKGGQKGSAIERSAAAWDNMILPSFKIKADIVNSSQPSQNLKYISIFEIYYFLSLFVYPGWIIC